MYRSHTLSPQKSPNPAENAPLYREATRHTVQQSLQYRRFCHACSFVCKYFRPCKPQLSAMWKEHLLQMHQLHADRLIPYSLHRRIYHLREAL